jgi:hypothetical protein
MINKSGELNRRAALKKFGLGLAGIALTASQIVHIMAADPSTLTSSVSDAAGDAVFPTALYGAVAVPPYLDLVQVSVRPAGGVFHFEIKVNAEIPANADPGFTPSVNHLGSTFGILIDRKTAQRFNFIGQQQNYYFNFLVGALYVVDDAGVGLAPGWHGFLQGPNGITEIPLRICGDTFIFETSAESLGNPSSFQWAAASECDPVPIPQESSKTTIVVDYAPNNGYANWPAQ